MISLLKLRNFQSHKHTDMEFVPGVNAIIGQSDSGKSSIVRALQWVITNRPVGEAFRSNWGGDTEVHLGIDKKKVIVRERAKENRYILWTSPTKDQVFQGFGSDIPEALAELIGFDDINMQGQHDSPFLLSSNAAEVARTLNRVAHLDDIDYSLSSVNSMIRQVNSKIKEVEFGLGEVADGLEKYEGLTDLEAELEALESLQSELNNLKSRKVWATTQIGLIEGIQSDIARFAAITAHADAVQELERLDVHAEETNDEADTLRKLIQEIRSTERSIEEQDALLKHKDEVRRLTAFALKLDANYPARNSLESVLELIINAEGWIGEYTERMETAQAKYDELMPDTCPLCGQEVEK